MFDQFDEDKSGAIDLKELQSLCAKLGNPVNDEQLQNAMKDLDLNGDGVIDFSEFSRWYFTGMKPYNGTRKALLTFGLQSRKLVDIMAEEARAALIGKEMKLNTKKFSFGFNAPKDPHTTINFKVSLGGQDAFDRCAELEGHYFDAVNKKAEHSRFVEGWRKHGDTSLYAEARFKVQPGTAQASFEKLSSSIETISKFLDGIG